MRPRVYFYTICKLNFVLPFMLDFCIMWQNLWKTRFLNFIHSVYHLNINICILYFALLHTSEMFYARHVQYLFLFNYSCPHSKFFHIHQQLKCLNNAEAHLQCVTVDFAGQVVKKWKKGLGKGFIVRLFKIAQDPIEIWCVTDVYVKFLNCHFFFTFDTLCIMWTGFFRVNPP